jgi:hypothetical protein
VVAGASGLGAVLQPTTMLMVNISIALALRWGILTKDIMWIFLLEAAIAVSLLIFIVWWTMKPPKKKRPPADKKD